jgi:hypothetical protein
MSDPRDRIDDPDAPPSEEERAEAERLRAALEDPGLPSEGAELARAMSSAWAPRDLSPAAHAALVEKALVAHDRRSRRRVVRVSFGASAVLALAAAVLLFIRSDRQPPETVASVAAAMAISRSTQPLFPDRFPARGGETSRIDRIAMARATDLRDNEFAKWGVR